MSADRTVPRRPWPTERVIRAAQRGDEPALSLLVTGASPHVQRFATTLCDSPQDAEDSAQEALIKLHEHVGTLRAAAALSSWLFRVVRNECIGRARLGRRRLGLFDRLPHGPESAADAESVALARDQTRRLVDAIGALPADQRAVLILRDLQGHSGAVTATALGLSKPAMKSRLHRARAVVRAELAAK